MPPELHNFSLKKISISKKMEQPRAQVEPHLVYRRPTPMTNLNNMRQNGEMCDITIRINDKAFRAHKIVLAAGLRYFHTLFSSNFRETNQDTIVMTTVNELNLESLISFAYTGEIQLNDDNVLSLLRDSDYLTEDDVKEACIAFLCGNDKPEMAIEIYEFGHRMNCTPLKESARQTIIANFAELSFTDGYLNLEFPMLRDILSADEVYAAQPQEYFERIVQWILHDVERRRANIRELLNLIYVVELRANYLIGYLYETVSPENDSIIREIMTFYRESTQRRMPRRNRAEMRLIIIDRAMLSHIQVYDLATNLWSLRYTNIDHVHYTVSAVLKDLLYIVGGRTDVECVADVRVYNPRTSLVVYAAPMTVARRDCAVGASSNYLFVCGGRGDDGSALNLVERFDPGQNRWETLAPMQVARYGAAVVVFQGCVYVIGGSDRERDELNVVERYDPASREWTLLEPMHQPRVSLALVVFQGKLYACGGWDKNSVEFYDPRSRRWIECANMQRKRDSFLVVAHDGKLMAVGGDADRSRATMEVYDPDMRQWRFLESRGLHNKYLAGGLIKV